MDENKKVVYDIDSYDIVTNALMKLLNMYPALPVGQKFKFCELGEDKGKAMYPASAPVQSGSPDILGYADCMYRFFIYYKAKFTSESQRIKAKEFLDKLGLWLSKKEVTINGNTYKLDSYPALTGDREFTGISRETTAILAESEQDKSELWVITLVATYNTKVTS